MRYLIEKYNKPESTLFISSFPEKNVRYSKKVCAVGGFTKNTIEALQRLNPLKKYVVVTVKIGKKTEIYEENNILVLRILDRDNPLSYLPTLKKLLSFTQIKTIVTEFEFGSFGGIQNASLFLLIPLILRVFGKSQIFVLHQVIENLDELIGHLGWSKDDIRKIVFNPLLGLFYYFVHLLSDKVVVTEEVFKDRLVRIVGKTRKVITIPHGVDTNIPIVDSDSAKKQLHYSKGTKVVLYFGYLSWYKGADLFFKYANKIKNKNIQFIMAGGPSFTNVEKPHYKKYLDNFKKHTKNIHITGFVPEEKIPLYFSAADLVVLPYRTMMSSSGPLSLAFSFEKPLILSNKMIHYMKTSDFSEGRKKVSLNLLDVFFPLNQRGFEEKVLHRNTKTLKMFSTYMKAARSYDAIAKKYEKLINGLLINTRKADTMNHYAFYFGLGATKK